MKKFLLLLIMALPLYCFAQETPYVPNLQYKPGNNKLDFYETVHVDTLTKAQIYWRARDWFTRYFEVGKAFVTMDSPTEGRIIGHGMMFLTKQIGLIRKPFVVSYNLIIDVKEKSYRYQFTDIEVADGLSGLTEPSIVMVETLIDKKYIGFDGPYDKGNERTLSPIEAYARNIIGSLKGAISMKDFEPKNLSDDF